MLFEVDGQITERSGINTGDLVKVACVAIEPHKDELEKVKEKLSTNIDANPMDYVEAKNGLLFKLAIIAVIRDGVETPYVKMDGGKYAFPHGKFGLMIYNKLDMNSLFIGKKDAERSWRIDAVKDGRNVEFKISKMPATWDELTNASRIDFWKMASSIFLKCGQGRPLIVTDKKGAFNLDFTSVHRMDVGTITTGYILSREYNGKTYKFIKPYVEKPSDGMGSRTTKKYLSKNTWDLFYYEDSAALSKEWCEGLHKAFLEKNDEAISFDPNELEDKPVF